MATHIQSHQVKVGARQHTGMLMHVVILIWDTLLLRSLIWSHLLENVQIEFKLCGLQVHLKLGRTA